jgi:16S rRNA G966 N2-methylase RsmD
MGVNRQLVHLSDAGRGVNRKRVSDDDETEKGILDWMLDLANRLKRVRVCCGDWTRVCGGRTGDSLKHFFAGGNRCAVFLDPPYSAESNRNETLYRCEDLSVAHAVREWAIKQGDDKRLRIALCGYEGEHDMPSNWRCHTWKARGGYASVSDGETQGKANAHREVIWFSPHCERVEVEKQTELFAESA